MRKRTEVLAEALKIKEEQIDSRYDGDPNEDWEFIVRETSYDEINKKKIVKEQFYDVLKEDEFEGRMRELFSDVDESTLEEYYGEKDHTKINYGEVDINVWLREINEIDGYFIFTSE